MFTLLCDVFAVSPSFEPPQRSVKIKIKLNFSLCSGLGREGLKLEKRKVGQDLKFIQSYNKKSRMK